MSQRLRLKRLPVWWKSSRLSAKIQGGIQALVSEDLLYDEKKYARLLEAVHPEKVDRFYTSLRRVLQASPSWAYGPAHLHAVLSTAFSRAGDYFDRLGTFCDIGCGKHNPFGASLVLYLNGADRCFALDRDRMDPRRATEAFNDLLVDILAAPGRWLFDPRTESLFRQRLREISFLRPDGNPFEDAWAGGLLQFFNQSLEEAPLAQDSIESSLSEGVLEYLNPFVPAMRVVWDFMRPGSVGYHMIDFRDHRQYRKPMPYGFWHYLTEDLEGLSRQEIAGRGITTNMLRYEEMGRLLREAGFEILRYEPVDVEAVPPEVARNLRGRYAKMPLEVLGVQSAWCVLRKPDAASDRSA